MVVAFKLCRISSIYNHLMLYLPITTCEAHINTCEKDAKQVPNGGSEKRKGKSAMKQEA